MLAIAVAVAGGAARSGSALAAEASIRAEISPREILAGETARLVVRITGTRSASPPSLPPIDGLEPGARSQQTSFNIVNGSMSSEIAWSWSLLAMRPGDFVIPPMQVDAGGTTLTTEPLSLRVVAAGQPPSSGAAGGAGGAASAGSRGGPGPGSATVPAGEEPPAVASLEIRIPDRELFVGESVPGSLVLAIREGVRVSDVEQPQLVGDAFTVTRPNDRQPDQTTATIGGRNYHLVIFPIAISPIRPGVHDLAASEVIHAVLPRERDRRRGPDDDPFSDSFFSGFFGEPRKLDVKARPLVLRVLPLPAEGRPADFSGAIGRFTIEATATPASVALGDPITQRVIVRGEGNLDRVEPVPLASDADWKVYPGTSRVETTDPLGVRGAKVFEQAIVPQRADLATAPTRRFSYFDPAERRYVSLETQPVAIAIAPPTGGAAAPGAGSTAPGAPAAPGAAGVDAAPAPETDTRSRDELAPNAIDPGEPVRDWKPLVRRPGWLAWHLAPLVLALAGLGWARHARRRDADPALRIEREARRLAEQRDDEMARARSAGDAGAWFSAARRAVQEAIAPRCGAAATSLGADAAVAALGDGRDLRLGDEVRAFFAAADAASYAGTRTDPAAIATWESRVDALLRDLRRPA